MKDQYTGGIGDFGKYGLLRALSTPSNEQSQEGLKLGIVWYLTPNSGTSDGKFVSYLEPSAENTISYRECDPQLYDGLKKIVCSEQDRRVARIREVGILQHDTAFYEELFTFEEIGYHAAKRKLRIQYRRQWLEGALRATEDCDLAFFDPDNGLQISSVESHTKNGNKYTCYDELEPFYRRGQSLLIYQHIPHESVNSVVTRRIEQISSYLGTHETPYALAFEKRGIRAFIVVSQPRHSENIKSLVEEFLRTKWSAHFKPIGIAL